MNYRFPGVKPFCVEEKNIFFGRDMDIQNLSELVSLKQLVVMHSKSGLGKSSLINAGLIPNFKEDFTIIPVRLRSYVERTDESIQKSFLYKFEAVKESFLNKILADDDGLWYHFKKQQIKHGNSNYLVIIDQFEELFSYPDSVIKQIASQISDLLYSVIPQKFRKALEYKFKNDRDFLSAEERELLFEKLNIKLLISLRSDKLSLLNKLKDYLPNLLQDIYELGPLTWEQAEDAIAIPASYSKKDMEFATNPFYVADDLLEDILHYLTQDKTKEIETFQLQILCQYIEKIVLKKEIKTIRSNDVGNFENIYKNYYENLLEQIENSTDRKQARRFIEDGLIFEEEERRVSLYEGQILRDFNINKPLLNKLVDTHLLRIEPHSSGGNYYEISHDTLIPPILKAKAIRHQKEEKQNALLKQEAAISSQKRKAKFYRNITYVVVIPLVILTVSTFYLFDKTLNLKYDLAAAEMKVTRLNKEKTGLGENISELKKSNNACQQQKEQLDIQVKFLVKTLNNIEKKEVIERIHTETAEKFANKNYEGAVNAMQSLQTFYDKIEANRSTQSYVYGHYAWYLLFIKDYSTAAFKANVGLSFDKNQVWINKNLAHALLLEGNYESAKKIYLEFEEKPFPLTPENDTFKDVFLKDFELLEEAGITHPKFDKIRALLTNVNQVK